MPDETRIVVVNKGPGCTKIACGTCAGMVLFSLLPVFLMIGGCSILGLGAAAVTAPDPPPRATAPEAPSAQAKPAPKPASPAPPPPREIKPTIDNDPDRGARLKAAREGDPRDRDDK